MKVKSFYCNDVYEIQRKYNDWLEENPSFIVVATSLFQTQYTINMGTCVGDVYLLVTYKEF